MAPDTLRRAASVHPIAAVQSEYSLWTRNAECGLLQACDEVGASFVAFSPLGRAFLSGVLQDVETFPKGDFRGRQSSLHGAQLASQSRSAAALSRLCPSARRRADNARHSLDARQGPAHRPDSGHPTAQHLKECADGGDLVLTNRQVEEIERILPIGFAAGERYPASHWVGIEKY